MFICWRGRKRNHLRPPLFLRSEAPEHSKGLSVAACLSGLGGRQFEGVCPVRGRGGLMVQVEAGGCFRATDRVGLGFALLIILPPRTDFGLQLLANRCQSLGGR